MPDKFFLTTPIYYVNARPHIGHAYTTIVADVLARRSRAQGTDTFFLTGTDEHGQKIERSAAAANIPPQQFADQVSQSFANLWQRMGITNDAFIRTTDAHHKRGVQKLFATLYERGQIYLSSYTGQYCVSEEMFVEGPPGTIGPDGKPTETVTEENFFFRLSDFQLPLLNLIESDTLKITPEARKNEVLSFLRGNVEYPEDPTRDPIQEAISDVHFDAIWESHPYAALGKKGAVRLALERGRIKFSSPSKKFPDGHPYVDKALKDLSVSRSSFTWGIPVPEPAASEAKEKHVIYVWLDALANYMTALGYGSDSPADIARFEKYWPADLHLVGKEIIRFHCVYWPAFLLAADLPLPKAITAHGWLLFEDSKMSKSKGNIVRTETILDAFGPLCPPTLLHPTPSFLSSRSEAEGSASPASATDPTIESASLKGTASAVPQTPPDEPAALAAEGLLKHHQDLFAADVLRYFLLREIPFGQDGSFSFEALVTLYNSALTNGYANLVSRATNLLHQRRQGQIPDAMEPWLCKPNSDEFSATPPRPVFRGTAELIDSVRRLPADVGESLENTVFHFVLMNIEIRITSVDLYLNGNKPWKLSDANPEESKKFDEILYTAAESIRIITALLYPILPYATANVWRQLGLGDIEAAAANGKLKNLQWGGLQPGTKLGPLSPIFPRADKKLIETMTQMEQDRTLSQANAAHDASTSEGTEFKETPIASQPPAASTDPAAPPRTSSLAEPNPGAQVAASEAVTTERPGTPPHTEASASGIFAAQTPADASPQITIDDFAKIELRVAKILVAERIPKADKLLRLEVDLGYERRQILSGIAEHYTPEELIGRRIVVITNLAPRKMRGLDSHGMLLAASEGEHGKPVLATFPETDEIPLGSRLK